MFRSDLGIYLAIISHNRPKNISSMTDKVGPATWYLGRGEAEKYVEEYNKLNRVPTSTTPTLIESGGLVETRNRILDEAFANGHTVVMMDDDLHKISHAKVSGESLKVAEPMSIHEAVQLMQARLRESRFAKFAGCAPTSNLFYYNPKKPVTTTGFIGGWFMMVKPNPLRFDQELQTKEDYDYTLQQIKTYGGVVRCNDILAEFAHYDNAGGVVDIRTSEVEQKSILRLKEKWGSAIRLNVKRENEILLNVK